MKRMKRFLFSMAACIAVAFSASASAATDHFKPSGTELHAFATQVTPDSRGAPVVAVLFAHDMAAARSSVTISAKRTWRTGAQAIATSQPSLKQIGIQADRGAEGRTRAI